MRTASLPQGTAASEKFRSALTRLLDKLGPVGSLARELAWAAAKHWRSSARFLRSRETAIGAQSRDGRTRYEWRGGSLRRFPPKIRGKAAVKAAKRARQRAAQR